MRAREALREAADIIAQDYGSGVSPLATALLTIVDRLDAEEAYAQVEANGHAMSSRSDITAGYSQLALLARLDAPLDVDPSSTPKASDAISTASPKGGTR
jgi:hypothetical protein